VGLVWLCGERKLKEVFENFYDIQYFCNGGWNGRLFWRSVYCNSREERVARKCICICV
jgi:hypothetical protein